MRHVLLPLRRLSPRLLLAASLLIPAHAFAAIDTQSIECPVDGSEVSVTILLSSNALLGHDRDLCPHASDATSDEIANSVSACPVCGFAGTPAEFRNEVPEVAASHVKSGLKPAGTAWERYANRSQILEWEKAPEAAIGESWLRAAWSVRLDERSAGDPALSEAIRRILAATAATGTGGKPAGAQSGGEVIPSDPILDPAHTLDAAASVAATAASDRAAALYGAGAFWRARGELAEAESRYVKALQAAAGTPLESAITGVVARDRASVALEKSYLERALGHFKAGLAAGAGKKLPPHQRTLVAFLGGECARRTGATTDATRLYREALSANDPDPQMKALAKQGLSDVKAAAAAAPPVRTAPKTKKAP